MTCDIKCLKIKCFFKENINKLRRGKENELETTCWKAKNTCQAIKQQKKNIRELLGFNSLNTNT